MNKREARKEGLEQIQYFSDKEKAKAFIKEEKAKFKGIRILLVIESSGSGYNRCTSCYAYAEKVYFDYKRFENFEATRQKHITTLKSIREKFAIAMREEEERWEEEKRLLKESQMAIEERIRNINK